MRAWRLGGLAILMMACGGPQAPPVARTAAPPATAASPTPIASSSAPPEPTPPAAEDAGVAAAPPAPPPPVERTGKVWPFHAWDRAEALRYNRFQMAPGKQLRVYDQHGWVPAADISERKGVSVDLGKKAVDLVKATRGAVDVSKCPFPRHAIVLYEGDVPIASIDVCFECGDILLWPDWEPPPDWDHLSDKQLKAVYAKREAQMKLYDKVFPKWKALFRDDVGYDVDEKFH